MKKIIVAGGRDFDDHLWLYDVCDEYFNSSEDVLLTGGCKGADQLGVVYALTQGRHGKKHETITYPADWGKHGKAAGPIRNKQMAQDGDMLIAFWDGKSRGTKNMIEEALKAGLEIHVYRYGDR